MKKRETASKPALQFSVAWTSKVKPIHSAENYYCIFNDYYFYKCSTLLNTNQLTSWYVATVYGNINVAIDEKYWEP